MGALECQAKGLGSSREPLQVWEQGHCVMRRRLRQLNVAQGGGGSVEAFWRWGAHWGTVTAERARYGKVRSERQLGLVGEEPRRQIPDQ